jgi:hypothetical protein
MTGALRMTATLRMTAALRMTALRMTALLTLCACASVGRPPGGPVDTDPPQVISASIDTNAVGVKAAKLDLHFNEVVAEKPAVAGGPNSPVSLDAIVLVSPRSGAAKVDWHRETISIEPRGGFKPNTTYRVTLLPGLADLRGNISKETRSYVFSTGPALEKLGILGRVFDWQSATFAPGAIVEAVAHAGTADSTIYIAVADSLGQFDVGPLAAGRYLIRSFIDADHNRDRGVVEKWDTVTVDVSDHRPSIELLDAQRDTAVIGLQGVQALDSVWIRVMLDKPYDPRTPLSPTMIAVKRADSSVVQVEAVMTEDRAQVLRQVADTAAPKPATPVIPAPPTDLPSTRPPEARPSLPSPRTIIFVRVNPLTPLKAGERYTIAVRALPNLLGRSGTTSGVFDGPRPPARPPK